MVINNSMVINKGWRMAAALDFRARARRHFLIISPRCDQDRSSLLPDQ